MFYIYTINHSMKCFWCNTSAPTNADDKALIALGITKKKGRVGAMPSDPKKANTRDLLDA